MPGPFSGMRVIEFTGIGPGPFCGMMLADHGAEVICIERSGTTARDHVLARSKKSIALDLKNAEGLEIAKKLCRSADALIEGFRPGVMERLGLGPDVLLQENPKLVYGRMTGWGQTGPYASSAGHDINYIALSGVLHTCGRAGEKPTPPVNYLGDFGGGGLLLAFGITSALLAVKNGADGQVIDCAMTDGSALLSSMTWSLLGMGGWKDERGVNMLDTGAHFYDTYETKDGKWISIGSIEPQFYALLREKAGLESADFDAQLDQSQWPALKEKLAAVLKMKTRDEWCAIMEMTDVCFAPVLSLNEAVEHPHNKARKTFVDVDGVTQPSPAPRYSGAELPKPKPTAPIGANTDQILADLGFGEAAVQQFRTNGAVS